MVLFLGIFGAALILLAFVLEQLNIWKNSDLIYDLVNFIGGALLVTYGLLIAAYPFVILNIIWAVFSLRDIVLDLRKK